MKKSKKKPPVIPSGRSVQNAEPMRREFYLANLVAMKQTEIAVYASHLNETVEDLKWTKFKLYIAKGIIVVLAVVCITLKTT